MHIIIYKGLTCQFLFILDVIGIDGGSVLFFVLKVGGLCGSGGVALAWIKWKVGNLWHGRGWVL